MLALCGIGMEIYILTQGKTFDESGWNFSQASMIGLGTAFEPLCSGVPSQGRKAFTLAPISSGVVFTFDLHQRTCSGGRRSVYADFTTPPPPIDVVSSCPHRCLAPFAFFWLVVA